MATKRSVMLALAPAFNAPTTVGVAGAVDRGAGTVVERQGRGVAQHARSNASGDVHRERDLPGNASRYLVNDCSDGAARNAVVNVWRPSCRLHVTGCVGKRRRS